MKKQFSDILIYKRRKYFILDTMGDCLVHSDMRGMHAGPHQNSFAKYKIIRRKLFLAEMTSRSLYRYDLPGAIVSSDGYYWDSEELDLKEEFTGVIRLARDIAEEQFAYVDDLSPLYYTTVLDISLVKGRVVDVKDLSLEVEQGRVKIKQRYAGGEELHVIVMEINRAFGVRVSEDS